jgi:hypothetical protein
MASKPPPEEKPKCFRIVKLEERIAPRGGRNTLGEKCVTNETCYGCYTGYSIE